jgi:glycosyltransferase involved in cell wall biosynthesis
MKILFVSLFLPQKMAYHAGGRYVYEVIERLSKRHEIHLATRLEEDERPGLESLRSFCKEVYPYIYRSPEKRGLIANARLVLNYIGFSRFADRLARENRFDVVHVEWVETALMMKKRETPMVLDAQDVITKPAERLMKSSRGVMRGLFSLRYLFIKALEARVVRKFGMVFTLSAFDRDYLLNMNPGLNVRVVPIPAGLDISAGTYEKAKDTILFLASYKYRKVNVDAALYFYGSVFPLVRKTIPGAKFIIAGYGPPETLTSIAEKDPSVSVPGFVADIDAWYKKAAVFVAPILVGGGIIVKVLDAMAAGTPVVTTSYGNEGIGAVPGRDLLVADDAVSFAENVIRVLSDKAYAASLAGNGREFVRKNFTLEEAMSRIESAYEKLVKREW